MCVEIRPELEDGRQARRHFLKTHYYRATGDCGDPGHCGKNVSSACCELIFNAMDVACDGDGVEAARGVSGHHRAPDLFRAVHMSSGFLDPPQFEILPRWDDHSVKELLELYLTGFSLLMLAEHWDTTTEDIVRSLSAVVFGDTALVKDRLKARHQKAWAGQEMQFLITQMQVGATPTEISALMERDSLGIAYKLFEALPVPLPKTIIERYGIAHGQEPLEPGVMQNAPVQKNRRDGQEPKDR